MPSKTTNKFSPEVRDRAVRMVLNHEAQHPSRKRKPVPTVDGVSFQATRASTAPLQFQGRSSPSLEARCPHASWSMA